jgi:hypothetical protein
MKEHIIFLLLDFDNDSKDIELTNPILFHTWITLWIQSNLSILAIFGRDGREIEDQTWSLYAEPGQAPWCTTTYVLLWAMLGPPVILPPVDINWCLRQLNWSGVQFFCKNLQVITAGGTTYVPHGFQVVDHVLKSSVQYWCAQWMHTTAPQQCILKLPKLNHT